MTTTKTAETATENNYDNNEVADSNNVYNANDINNNSIILTELWLLFVILE